MIAQMFHDFLVFFADHCFKGFLVGCGVLTLIASLLEFAGVVVQALVTLIRGHKPARTKIVCEKAVSKPE